MGLLLIITTCWIKIVVVVVVVVVVEVIFKCILQSVYTYSAEDAEAFRMCLFEQVIKCILKLASSPHLQQQ